MSLRVLSVRTTGVMVEFEIDLDSLKKILEALDGTEFAYTGEGRRKECVTYLTEVFYKQIEELVKNIEGGR